MPRKARKRKESFTITSTKKGDQVLLQIKRRRRRRISRIYNASSTYWHFARNCRSLNKRKHEASTVDVDEDTPHKKSQNDDCSNFFF